MIHCLKSINQKTSYSILFDHLIQGGLASLPNLNELGLAHNTKLSLLPSFESLKALQTLNLSHCNFSNVPLLAEALQGESASFQGTCAYRNQKISLCSLNSISVHVGSSGVLKRLTFVHFITPLIKIRFGGPNQLRCEFQQTRKVTAARGVSCGGGGRSQQRREEKWQQQPQEESWEKR